MVSRGHVPIPFVEISKFRTTHWGESASSNSKSITITELPASDTRLRDDGV